MNTIGDVPWLMKLVVGPGLIPGQS